MACLDQQQRALDGSGSSGSMASSKQHQDVSAQTTPASHLGGRRARPV